MIRKLQIGDVQLENNLILAPMAGVTDLPFRLLCKEQGAGLLCMEMVSAKAILYNNKNTEALMAIDDREPPVSLQLFGSDPDVISEMAKRIEERPFSILDINMGCPVPKVTGNGEGSALMKNPKLVEEIITKTARAIKKPVTVKIRKGFDDEHVNAVEIAKIAEASGAAAIAVHGRTREQYYSGKADWDIIRQVKEAVKIPVIGNGDVTSAESADAIMRETGCDGVMIGRGAQGNPWIFHQILHWMETGEHEAKPTLEEVKFADLLIHVADSSYEACDFHIEVTDQVLKEIGAGDKEKIIAYNKCDIAETEPVCGEGCDWLWISAKRGDNIDKLTELIKEKIFSDRVRTRLLIPFDRGDVVSYLCGRATVFSMDYTGEGTVLDAEMSKEDYGRYKKYDTL